MPTLPLTAHPLVETLVPDPENLPNLRVLSGFLNRGDESGIGQVDTTTRASPLSLRKATISRPR